MLHGVGQGFFIGWGAGLSLCKLGPWKDVFVDTSVDLANDAREMFVEHGQPRPMELARHIPPAGSAFFTLGDHFRLTQISFALLNLRLVHV